MRKILILVVLAISSAAWSQSTCTAKSTILTFVTGVTTKDTTEHVPGGFHSASVVPVATCFYIHTLTGLPSCDTQCSVITTTIGDNTSGINATDSGALLPEVRGIQRVAGDGGDPCLGGGGFTQGDTGSAPNCSPIIIDVTGEGIKLTPVQFGVPFDMKGTGIKSIVAWTWPGEGAQGFLALDRNGNGKIDDGTELFGNFSAQPPSNTPNGFAALAEFDKPENGGNGDGVISPADAIYSKLLVWVDYNHNGISDPDELKHLSDYHIEAIDLNYREDRRVDQYGNAFRFKAKILSDNSGKGSIGRLAWDVFLQAMRDPARDRH